MSTNSWPKEMSGSLRFVHLSHASSPDTNPLLSLAAAPRLHQSPHGGCLCRSVVLYFCQYDKIQEDQYQVHQPFWKAFGTYLLWLRTGRFSQFSQFYRSPESGILGCVWIQWDLTKKQRNFQTIMCICRAHGSHWITVQHPEVLSPKLQLCPTTHSKQ